MKINFRVECNHGSKYFDKGTDAFTYFHTQALKGLDVEIWLRQIEKTRRFYSITEELLDFNGRNVGC